MLIDFFDTIKEKQRLEEENAEILTENAELKIENETLKKHIKKLEAMLNNVGACRIGD